MFRYVLPTVLAVCTVTGCQSQPPGTDPFPQPMVPAPPTGSVTPGGYYGPSSASPGATSPYGGAPQAMQGTTGLTPSPSAPAAPGYGGAAGGGSSYVPPGGWPSTSSRTPWRQSTRVAASETVKQELSSARDAAVGRFAELTGRGVERAGQVVDRTYEAAERLDSEARAAAYEADARLAEARSSAARTVRQTADEIQANVDHVAEGVIRVIEPPAEPRRLAEDDGEEADPFAGSITPQP